MADFDRVRVLWPDHLGIARGKYIPARHANRGTAHCAAVFALGYDKDMTPAPGSYMLEGFPDVETEFSVDDIRPCWEDRTGVVVADLMFRGEPYAVSARGALRRAIADWEALGYSPKIGIELEAYVMEPDGQGGWTPWNTPYAYVYSTGTIADPVGLMDEIMRTAEASGIKVESINSEYFAPQFELTLEYDDALRAVDDAFLFKVLAREVAHKHGLHLTFMGRPFADRGGSGLHINMSLADDSQPNALNDPSTPDGLSALAKGCLAGLVGHHRGMTALCAPTVNAYKRLRPGELSGYWASWGHDHRCTANRVPSMRGNATRIENRLADAGANIHLVAATVLQAARLGFVSGVECPGPETGDGLEDVCTDVHCAHNLAGALDDLEADTELVEAVGAELVANFVVIKRAEWDRFEAAVTDWELKEYLPYL
ncbi:MAG TPA: glutamine synthetase family protein [Acidimicrobiales bacterium]|nr:glutamine synthetase family protein [Acidimicrobiales bacterium]